MSQRLRVALIVEMSTIYGRQILEGIVEYTRSHQPWSIFLEQRAEATFQSWREPFVHLRVPLLVNLRRDPYERGMVTSNTYDDWFLDRVFLLSAAKDYVGQFLMTFKEYPPRQKAGSFNLDQVMEQLTSPGAH